MNRSVACLELKLFSAPTGTWLKSGLGLVHQEGSQLTWTYIAPQLGYWVAAMSPPNPGNTEAAPAGMGNDVLRGQVEYTFENNFNRDIPS